MNVKKRIGIGLGVLWEHAIHNGTLQALQSTGKCGSVQGMWTLSPRIVASKWTDEKEKWKKKNI